MHVGRFVSVKANTVIGIQCCCSHRATSEQRDENPNLRDIKLEMQNKNKKTEKTKGKGGRQREI